MADNTTLNSGSGGDTIAADDISSVKYPRSKLIHGADGVNDGDVSTANPFPVRLYIGTTIVSVGAGVVDSGTPRITHASDDPVTASLSILDDWDDGSDRCRVVGAAAHDAAVAGNPLLLAGYASAAAPADVSGDGDAVRLWADRAGRLQVGDGGTTLSVDDGAGSLTVDGTVAATQSGTWNIGTVTTITNVVHVDDNAGSLTVDGTVSVSGTVTVDSELPTAAALADTTANPTTPLVGAAIELFNGTTWDRARGDITNGLDVDVTRVSGTVTISGTVTANAGTNLNTSALALESGGNLAGAATSLAILDDWDETDRCKVNPIVGQAGVAAGAGAVGATVQRVTLASDDPAVASLSVLDDWDNAASDGASVSGDVAHGSADAGEPVKVGYKAIAHGTNPTAVSADQRTNAYANRAGIPFVIGGHPNVITKTALVTDADNAQTDAALVTVGAGAKIVVTRVSITADNDNTDDINVKVGFGTATLPADAVGGANGILVHHPGVPAGGGITVGDGSGILGIGADNEDLRLTCADPVGGSIAVSVSFYTIES